SPARARSSRSFEVAPEHEDVVVRWHRDAALEVEPARLGDGAELLERADAVARVLLFEHRLEGEVALGEGLAREAEGAVEDQHPARAQPPARAEAARRHG